MNPFRRLIVNQFERPHGLLGYLAGRIMAGRESNRLRSTWTVDLLDLKESHNVLEFGCGPGIALSACARIVKSGSVAGVDHSSLMIGQSRRRLERQTAECRVDLSVGGLDILHAEERLFDRIYSVNVIQFFPDPSDYFSAVLRALAIGGRTATTYQPRNRNPTREYALAMANRIETAMHATGFADLKTEELALKPVPAICVLGEKRA